MVTLADDYKPSLPNSVGSTRLYRDPEGELVQCMGVFPTIGKEKPLNLWIYSVLSRKVFKIETTPDRLKHYESTDKSSASASEREALRVLEEKKYQTTDSSSKPAAPKKTLSLG